MMTSIIRTSCDGAKTLPGAPAYTISFQRGRMMPYVLLKLKLMFIKFNSACAVARSSATIAVTDISRQTFLFC